MKMVDGFILKIINGKTGLVNTCFTIYKFVKSNV